jgi:hypothetical protein
VARKGKEVGEFIKHDLRIIWVKTTCFPNITNGKLFPRLCKYLEKFIFVDAGNSITRKTIDKFMVTVNPSLP